MELSFLVLSNVTKVYTPLKLASLLNKGLKFVIVKSENIFTVRQGTRSPSSLYW